MDWALVLQVGLAVVSVGTLTGLGLLRGVVTNLREQLHDERELNASLRLRRTEDEAAIAQLQTDLNALGRVVTAEAHWIAVSEALETHHNAVTGHWEAAAAHWRDELTLLRRIADRGVT